MIQLFSPREWAIGTWLVFMFMWAVLQEKIRRSMWSIVESVFHWQILAPLTLVIIYAGTIVYLYQTFRLDYDRIWIDAALWIFYGFYLVGRYITRREYSHVWRDVLRENLRGAVLLELIIYTYTFSFIVELILVPVIVFVSMLGAVAKLEERYVALAKLTDW